MSKYRDQAATNWFKDGEMQTDDIIIKDDISEVKEYSEVEC